MLVEGQKIKVKWNPKNIPHYKERGYEFTGLGKEFYVGVDDLMDNSNMVIKALCDYCGDEYETTYQHYNRCRKKGQKDACRKCIGVKNADVTFNDRIDSLYLKIVNKCNEFGYKLLTLKNELKGTRSRIKYICPIHGIHEVRADGLLQGKQCPKCANVIKNQKHTQTTLPYRQQSLYERILKVCEEKNYILKTKKEEIKNNLTYITYICPFHGEHKMRTYNFINGKGCPDCAPSSKGEIRVKKFLDDCNIKYTRQHTFDDCKDVNLLPFDFYLSECNLIIEYSGQQHYEPIEYFGGEEKFLIQQKHDKIKKEYCENNNINFLEIPYWEFNEIEDILNKKLSLHEDMI